jgi:MoxR-like ATPase
VGRDPSTISVTLERRGAASAPANVQLGLLIAWSASEPARLGEVALLAPGQSVTLGRGAGDEAEARATFVRQRPGANQPTAPLGGLGLSRDQLRVRANGNGEGLEIERLGRRPLELRGVEVDRCTLRPGDTLHVRDQLVLLCVERPEVFAAGTHFPDEACGAFGASDELGILGESPLTWRTRERIAFASRSGEHVLILGQSGTGKELAANAIHRLSSRRTRPFVGRNAATLPKGLIDAELFGNAKNYPNAGMSERAGLVGEANGGTLFLDEIAELPTELQSHLLRVLDAGGDYQRLGESSTRRSDFVLVGATNRDPGTMKHDLVARFAIRLELPSLREHPDDIPLLVQHLLLRASKKSPQVVERFMADVDGVRYARVDPALVVHLLEREYPGNVRDLDAVLWRAMAESPGDVVVASEPVLAMASAAEAHAGPGPDAAAVRAALAQQDGSMTRAAAALGLSSRYALYRLMKRLGMDPKAE